MMMKHVFSFVLLGLGAAALGGCPIYSDDDRAQHRVCVGSDCYSCPDRYVSSDCRSYSCYDNSDCPTGYACGSDRRCHLTDGTTPTPPTGTTCTKPSDCPAGSNCGADNKCHAGACDTSGCPSGYVCKLDDGKVQCVAVSTGPSSTCKSDSDCPTPAGSKCLTGQCVAPANQCADSTQCAAGFQCVGGACTPSCSDTKPCPTGYTCDPKGVCTGNSNPCTSSSQCSGGTVCVQQHCVDPCGAGLTCPAGLKCVDGGCTPDQKPVFSCTANDGLQGECQAGSICLRHSCYIGCDQDAGPDACKNADTFNVCKSVTTTSGSFSVCGSSSNLGSDCDPTASKNCSSPLVCIDGYCK